jgi:hypothetical protein
MCQIFQCEMRVMEEHYWVMTGIGAVMLLLISFWHVEVGFQLCVFSVLTCAEFDFGHILQCVPIAYVECLYISKTCSCEITGDGGSYLHPVFYYYYYYLLLTYSLTYLHTYSLTYSLTHFN